MSSSGFPENFGLKYDQPNCGTCTGGAHGCIGSWIIGFAGGLGGFGGGFGDFLDLLEDLVSLVGLEDLLAGLVSLLVVLGLVLVLGIR